ncbi:DUF6274 family protein [Streptomyces venezuelae]|uniref:Uncharacterized protein n=2 Tax=Streptomyces venezuelae TaxID=54571 RepID=F2REL0_STRVP|nr:DUF6274 family protein [Streptomyces venezuelae]QES00257.1 hypothetical protein DEJ43_19215 [Streptomyces venezuelae ATCC 10712]APE22877.1 hypothetical protein vnz_18950 [Streptomyces venezuelae]QES07334.1 hypothetical protein DEJ44_18165 [Streptomyces venezuelae]QES13975.1 hypothetical protein DEJ45_17185 [Streptomyces venezuelae]CCA57133.1 hypothetical protein SVEN_3847 [Streptomyces venezuelae ATCC 10712]
MAAASAARHDTRALLRAHLAAASRYGHLTRHCVVCHRLLRLAMELPEPPEPPEAPEPGRPEDGPQEGPGEPQEPADGTGDESPTDP